MPSNTVRCACRSVAMVLLSFGPALGCSSSATSASANDARLGSSGSSSEVGTSSSGASPHGGTSSGGPAASGACIPTSPSAGCTSGGTDAGPATGAGSDAASPGAVVGDVSRSHDGCPESAPYNPFDWAAWPMPNSAPDVAAGAPNPASYTDHGDGTVTDDVTGLLWEQTATPATYTSGAASVPGTAAAYCAGLTLARRTDWRVPTLIELFSLLDVSGASPFIDSNTFKGFTAEWSATIPGGMGDSTGYVFDFEGGGPGMQGVGNRFSAICVASSAPAPSALRYASADGVVTDGETKLVWQQAAAPSQYSWGDAGTAGTSAQGYCSTLALGGRSGFRVPTLKELATIFDFESACEPLVDTGVFPMTPVGYYWSSTPYTPKAGAAWLVSFAGYAMPITPNATGVMGQDLRCVR